MIQFCQDKLTEGRHQVSGVRSEEKTKDKRLLRFARNDSANNQVTSN